MEWEAREDELRQKQRDVPGPLVDAAMMRRLNPYALKSERDAQANLRPTTLEDVTALAIQGFTKNAFLLVVDGEQVRDLEKLIPFRTTSEVTFIRLVHLVGG
jgi:hypothetical protein